MTALSVKQLSSSSISATHSSRDFPKCRTPFRKLPLVKPRAQRCGCVERVKQVGNMQQQRTSSSILNGLRRNYSARGLPTQPLPSTLPDNRPPVAVNAEISSMDRTSPSSSVGSLNGNVVFGIKNARRTVALLKFSPSSCRDDDDTDDETVMSDSDSECDEFASSSQHPDRTYSIRFDSYVKVVEIPNRFSYTSMQRQLMWSGNKAIRENARRNRLEYEWEGSHWRNVVEEDEFFLVDGKKVHPVHALR